jgi:hypothetical protein
VRELLVIKHKTRKKEARRKVPRRKPVVEYQGTSPLLRKLTTDCSKQVMATQTHTPIPHPLSLPFFHPFRAQPWACR